jgi:hypothetical protein
MYIPPSPTVLSYGVWGLRQAAVDDLEGNGYVRVNLRTSDGSAVSYPLEFRHRDEPGTCGTLFRKNFGWVFERKRPHRNGQVCPALG